MNKLTLFIVGLFLTVSLSGQQYGLDPVRIIGNDEDDKYTFFKIKDIHIENDGGFVVTDRIRMKVSKYNSKGKFVKRIGTPGQGPGEFTSINGINSSSNRYYVSDTVGKKIIVYDKDLNYIKQIRTKPYIIEILNIYDDNSLLTCNYFGNNHGYKRFVKINPKGELVYSFFNKCWYGDFRKKKDDYLSNIGFASVRGSYNKRHVIFGFFKCAKDTEFFVYTDEGKHVKTLKYRFKDDKYKLHMKLFSPAAFLKLMDRIDNKGDVYEIKINGIFIHNNYYIAFLKYVKTKSQCSRTDYNMFLVFNLQGKLVHEEDLCNDLDFLDMNNKGQVIAIDRNTEPVTVQIHQFTYK